MQTLHDVDVLLLLATLLAAKRRPAELVEIMAAIDLIQRNIPAAPKLVDAFSRLAGQGLLIERDGGYALTPEALEIVADLPRKADADERLFIAKDRLSMYAPKGEHAPITVGEAALNEAIAAHRAAGQGAGKNLLVPKPKPEGDKQRPGQRQRRPLPARKRKV